MVDWDYISGVRQELLFRRCHMCGGKRRFDAGHVFQDLLHDLSTLLIGIKRFELTVKFVVIEEQTKQIVVAQLKIPFGPERGPRIIHANSFNRGPVQQACTEST